MPTTTSTTMPATARGENEDVTRGEYVGGAMLTWTYSVSRCGVPLYKGPARCQVPPTVLDKEAADAMRAMLSNGYAASKLTNPAAGVVTQVATSEVPLVEEATAPESFLTDMPVLARLHPGCALTAASYSSSTASAQHVLDNAKVSGNIHDVDVLC